MSVNYGRIENNRRTEMEEENKVKIILVDDVIKTYRIDQSCSFCILSISIILILYQPYGFT